MLMHVLLAEESDKPTMLMMAYYYIYILNSPSLHAVDD